MVYLILAKVILPQEGVPFLILLQLFYTMGRSQSGEIKEKEAGLSCAGAAYLL